MNMRTALIAAAIGMGVGLVPTPSVFGPPIPPRVTLPPTVFAPYQEASPPVQPPPKPSERVSGPFRCGKWRNLALTVGWTEAQWPVLDFIIWRESRCQPEVVNTTLNGDGSHDYGLTQINDKSWCLPNRWYENGYLQHRLVVSSCDQLRWPIYNLVAALVIHNYSLEVSGNGWLPWGLDA